MYKNNKNPHKRDQDYEKLIKYDLLSNEGEIQLKKYELI